MKKTDFDKLKVGDKVIVSGEQDGEKFEAHRGKVLESGGGRVRIRFIAHTMSAWSFFREELKGKTITVEREDVPSEPKPKKRPHGAQEYKGNGNHTWENVDYTRDGTQRLRVPGGWLYRYGDRTPVFVPVPTAVGYAV